MNLDTIRINIDNIDNQIIQLFEKRMEMSRQVAQYKMNYKKPIFDKIREEEKLEAVKNQVTLQANVEGIYELFEQIMAISRKIQYEFMTENKSLEDEAKCNERIYANAFTKVEKIERTCCKVVFQGAEGAYSQAAMKQYFGDDVDSFHVDLFQDAMNAIETGCADFAVLPMENSTAGIVSEIYDLLVEHNNYIVGEQIIKIEHCLMGLENSKIEDIKTIYSHPQSFLQSSKYLRGKPEINQISMKNNAFAASKVKKDNDITKGAIASELAALTNGLTILERNISDCKNNSTRFIILSNKKIFFEKANKVSICFEVDHKSGSLHHMLSHFIYNHINMTKIESRPIEGQHFQYRFFIDFDGNLQDSAVENALKGLAAETSNMKIIGNY